MVKYSDWAARNLPTTVDAANADRFVEYSQADLDAYAEKAFLAGGRGLDAELHAAARQFEDVLANTGHHCWELQHARKALRHSLKIYWGLAATGWVAATAALIGVYFK